MVRLKMLRYIATDKIWPSFAVMLSLHSRELVAAACGRTFSPADQAYVADVLLLAHSAEMCPLDGQDLPFLFSSVNSQSVNRRESTARVTA